MNEHKTKNTLLKRILKLFATIIAIILCILILSSLLFHFPPVQKKLTNLTEQKLSKQFNTTVQIKEISITLPNRIIINNIFIEGTNNDTLANVGHIQILYNAFALLNKKIEVDFINIENARLNLIKSPQDSTYNYSFITQQQSQKQNDTIQKDSTQKQWTYDLGRLRLQNISLLQFDKITGNKNKVRIGNLHVKAETIKPANNLIEIQNILIKNTSIDITTRSKKIKKPQPFKLDIKLTQFLEIKNVNLNINDHVFHQVTSIDSAHAFIRPEKMNIPDKQIRLQKAAIKHTSLTIKKTKMTRKDSLSIAQFKQKKKSLKKTANWQWSIHNLKLENNAFKLANREIPPPTTHFDANNINLHDITLQAKNIHVSEEDYQGNVEHVSFYDENGFTVNNLEFQLNANNRHAEINNFVLVTPATTFQHTTTIEYPSLQKISTGNIKVNLEQSGIGMKDIVYFVPSLKRQFDICRDTAIILNINGLFKASQNNIGFRKFRFGIGAHTGLNISGNISHYNNIRKLSPDIMLDTFYTSHTTIFRILEDSLKPKNIAIPKRISMSGNIKEIKSRITTDMNIQTSQGYLNMEGVLKRNPQDSTEHYSLQFNTDYQLGQLLKNEQLGAIILNGKIDGTSKQFKNHRLTIEINSDIIEYNDYAYQAITIQGNTTKNYFNGTIASQDSNIRFTLKGQAGLRDSIPKYEAVFDLYTADLQAINLSNRDIRCKGRLQTEFSGNNINNINGTINIYDILVFNGEKKYSTDSVVLRAYNDRNSTDLKADSDFLHIRYTGSVKMQDLEGIIKNHLNHYFQFQDTLIKPTQKQKHFNAYLKITDNKFITDILFPDLVDFEPVLLKASYNDQNTRLKFKTLIPGLQYQSINIDSLTLNIDSDENSMTYATGFNLLQYDSLIINNTNIYGDVLQQTIHNKIVMLDSRGAVHYKINSRLHNKEDALYLHINPDTLILNKKDWDIPAENNIQFIDKQIHTNKFILKRNNEKFVIHTRKQTNDGLNYTDFIFSDFHLSTLFEMAGITKQHLSANINGEVTLIQDTALQGINANFTMSDLFVLNHKMFNTVDINASKTGQANYQATITMKDKKDYIKVVADYHLVGKNDNINANAEIESIHLEKIHPFISGQFSELSGPVSGGFSIKGTTEDPEYKGTLKVNNIHITPKLLNTGFILPEGEITLQNKILTLKNIIVLDRQKNRAKLAGTIGLGQTNNLGLKFSANHFKLLNTKPEADRNFYGNVSANLNADINGTTNAPVIDMKLDILQNTNFYFVTPQKKATIEEEGIVHFIQDDTAQKTIFKQEKSIQSKDTLVNRENKNINLTTNIKIEKGAVLHIIVDPATNEALEVQGNANLSFAMNKGGGQSLTGRYVIEKGKYTLQLYNFIQREFIIQEGSYINWIGDVANAQVHIDAYYKVNTAPISLVSSDLPAMTAEERLIYKNRLPFLVFLNIRGDMTSPQINFNIKLKEKEQNAVVKSKLSQLRQNESQLNKQVFSLLIFKNFVSSPSSTETPSNYEINNTARSGISNLISNQLNQFANQYIKGVDINLDVSSYQQYREQQQVGKTQVELDVSKQFMDERLKVSIGGNVAIQDEIGERIQNKNSFTGDVELEYSLTDDGRYRIKAYNKTDYENVLEGQIRKTGVALTYYTSFESFKNLFTNKNKRKKKQ